MILKQSNNPPNQKKKPNIRIFRIIAVSVLLTALSSLIFSLAFLRLRCSPHRYEDLKKLPSQLPQAFANWMGSWTTPIEIMVLDIDMEHIRQLEYQRQEALTDFANKDFSFVPGKIGWKGEHFKASFRLKGDRYLHFSDPDQWSFRVKLKEGEAMELECGGFPFTRQVLAIMCMNGYFMVLERKGLLLNYQFFRLQLNGTDLGIYALEEHFEKQVVERAGFRDGPIIRLDESLSADVLYLGEWEPYQEGKWTREENVPLLENAVALLEGFRQGQLPVSQVFDPEKMARFFALADLLKMHHATVWKSMRFYYNPLTGKLEPIGFTDPDI
ncbi:MAG: hypothetical protein R3B93_12925 [Bacteroidia bacterium]